MHETGRHWPQSTFEECHAVQYFCEAMPCTWLQKPLLEIDRDGPDLPVNVR